jgi:hypothetical protein
MTPNEESLPLPPKAIPHPRNVGRTALARAQPDPRGAAPSSSLRLLERQGGDFDPHHYHNSDFEKKCKYDYDWLA